MSEQGIVAQLNGPRAAFAVVLAVVFGGFLLVGGVPVTGPTVFLGVLVVTFFVANAYDPVRDHQLYRLGKAAWAAAILGLLVVLEFASGLLPYVLFAAACLIVGVEIYNYRNGTDHLHVDA